MDTLRAFISGRYGLDPVGLSKFATTSSVLVRITRRYWRGQKVMGQAEVTVENRKVEEAAATQPRWKLLPTKVRDQFAALDAAVDMLIRTHCVYPKADPDGPTPLLTGGGNYAVDAANWPSVQASLRQAQAAWGAAADSWCTADGYEEFHSLLKAQIGDADYERVVELVPARDKLRTKFGLDVAVLPIRLAEDVGGDAGAEAGREAVVVELIEAAVRRPREEAAAAWLSLADQLAVPDGVGGLDPVRPTRRSADGTETSVGRQVPVRSLAAVRRDTLALFRAERYVDGELRSRAEAVLAELPEAADALNAHRKKLSTDDPAAVNLSKLLRAAAASALDESAMCRALEAAVTQASPLPSEVNST